MPVHGVQVPQTFTDSLTFRKFGYVRSLTKSHQPGDRYDAEDIHTGTCCCSCAGCGRGKISALSTGSSMTIPTAW